MKNDPKKPVRIDLTDEQQNKIEEQTGVKPQAIEFTVEELEERVAPRRFSF